MGDGWSVRRVRLDSPTLESSSFDTQKAIDDLAASMDCTIILTKDDGVI